jgi:uncharacterized membrane protein YphA (DoxX/SURF4 family)
MNILLWVLQVLLGIFFILNGIQHFIVPPGLPELFQWMYDLPTWLHLVSGTAELLGGLGLILPGVLKIQTRLTPLAGAGLTLVMLGAAAWHIPRGETPNIVLNIFLAVLAAFVAYGRWRLSPLTNRS